MLNQHNLERHKHKWRVEERKIEDFSYSYMLCPICHEVRYPAMELQKLIDYSKERLYFFVEDWILVLLLANNTYISGITHYQKMLFLIFHDFVIENKIPSENPGFFAYKYGPYSDRIDNGIEILIRSNLIKKKGRKSSSKEKFYITEFGKLKAEKMYNKLSKNQKMKLKEFKKNWDQKSTKAIKKYVYKHYPKYTENSLILKEVFPDRKLYRKRG